MVRVQTPACGHGKPDKREEYSELDNAWTVCWALELISDNVWVILPPLGWVDVRLMAHRGADLIRALGVTIACRHAWRG